MYINDVHILFYVLIGIVGAFIGQCVNYSYKCFVDEKKIFSKETYTNYKKTNQINFFIMIINALLYIGILYKFGIHTTFIENINLIKFIVLTPLMLCAALVDHKIQIIPNRLNLLIFEIGLIITFILGMNNLTIAKDMLLRNACRWRNFFTYNNCWWTYCRKRSNGTWRCKTNGSIRPFLWLYQYNCDFYFSFSNWSNSKYNSFDF